MTGLIVSKKVNVSQKYVRDIRNLLYIWDRYGYIAVCSKFYPKYKEEKGHVKKGYPDLVNVIDGKLMYLKMVKGEDDSVYQRLNSKFRVLVASLSDPNKTNVHGITYVENMSIKDFEKKYNTEIKIKESFPVKYVCSPDASKEQIEEAKRKSQETHRYGSFYLGRQRQMASVNKSITKDDEQRKDDMYISLCRDSKGKMFWLLHKSKERTVPNPSLVNIDELNKDLDSLLSM